MEIENSKLVPIVLVTDDNFAPYCSVTICSIIKTASPESEYRIYIFHDSLSEDNIKVFENQSTANVKVSCVDVSKLVRPELMYETHAYPRQIYFRLFIAEILPQYEKAIYMDCDTVVVSDLAQLYDTDLQGNILGAVQDVQHKKRQKETMSQLGIDAYKYFNSGVLLIDIQTFERERVKEKCYELLEKGDKFFLPDQDALNLSCLDKVLYLPLRWNLMAGFSTLPFYYRNGGALNKKFNEALAAPGIVHYAGNCKPDRSSFLGINNYFWDSASESPFFNQIFKAWLWDNKKTLFPQDIYSMFRDIMLTGQCGWKGFLEITEAAFRSRIKYLTDKRRAQR